MIWRSMSGAVPGAEMTWRGLCGGWFGWLRCKGDGEGGGWIGCRRWDAGEGEGVEASASTTGKGGGGGGGGGEGEGEGGGEGEGEGEGEGGGGRGGEAASAAAAAGAADVVPLAQPLSAYPPLRMELRRLACISTQSDGKKPTRRLPRSKTTSWWRMLAAPMTAPLCSLSKTPRHQMPWRSSYAY